MVPGIKRPRSDTVFAQTRGDRNFISLEEQMMMMFMTTVYRRVIKARRGDGEDGRLNEEAGLHCWERDTMVCTVRERDVGGGVLLNGNKQKARLETVLRGSPILFFLKQGVLTSPMPRHLKDVNGIVALMAGSGGGSVDLRRSRWFRVRARSSNAWRYLSLDSAVAALSAAHTRVENGTGIGVR